MKVDAKYLWNTSAISLFLCPILNYFLCLILKGNTYEFSFPFHALKEASVRAKPMSLQMLETGAKK